MGAKISGAGSDTIVIDGVAELHGVEYEIIPDRIVTGTLLLCGARTRGDVTVTSCRPGSSRSVHDEAARVRRRPSRTATIGFASRRARSPAAPTFSPRRIPDFPTDLQPQMVSFLCTVPGTSVVEESIFNARFSYVNELARMGADVRVSMESNTAVVKGVTQLSGAPVEAPDIRAGAGARRRGACGAGRNRDHRSGIHRPRLRALGRDAFGARRPSAALAAASRRSSSRPDFSKRASILRRGLRLPISYSSHTVNTR